MSTGADQAGEPASVGQLRDRVPQRYVVCTAAEVPEGGRKIVQVAGRSVGIFNVEGTFHALLNRCPHNGAPLCEGTIVGLLEADRPGEFRFDRGRKHIRCPWHGWEFELATGRSYFDPTRVRARHHPVVLERGLELGQDLSAGVVKEAREGETLLQASVLPVEVEDDYIILSLR